MSDVRKQANAMAEPIVDAWSAGLAGVLEWQRHERRRRLLEELTGARRKCLRAGDGR